MSRITVYIILISLSIPAVVFSQTQKKNLEQRVNRLLSQMTLEEKVGQLTQFAADRNTLTGPEGKPIDKLEEIKAGRIGSLLNVRGASQTRKMQEAAMQSRLRIPLLFGLDVIHGYKVSFPIPLAEAASWNLQAIEQSARIAATESAAAGIHWTFAPMVDIARDPRWGRVAEGAGEDPYLGSLIAKARVKGFQGRGLGDTASIMACAKHFAAYGAPIAGRDYNNVDMSEHLLRSVYLPPFKAAVDAGVATFMNAFSLLNGIPATGNVYLQRKILKGEWKFDGFVVSDWNSISEMVTHGFARDKAEAASIAIKAGSDMDMESHSYIDHLAKLVKQGKVNILFIDEAVRRVFWKKFELGLFDDPYKYCNEQRESEVVDQPSFHQAAKDVARKSIVLLKNEQNILPLTTDIRKLAIIGPLAKSGIDMKGPWAVKWDKDSLISVFQGLQNRKGHFSLSYAKGCEVNDTSTAGFPEAIAVAEQADVIVMVLGESYNMSGEAKSRANIHLPGNQEELAKAIIATGKPTICLIMAGRPLIFNWIADHAAAILYTWFLGSEAGNAIADVLFGDYNPSGRLPMTFPRAEGQIPLFYSATNTGRPVVSEKNTTYKSAYIDLPNTPRYAFGYGLGYSTFRYSNLTLNKKKIHRTESVILKFEVSNEGKYDGRETVQLYLRDMVASVVRPVKELKGFQQVFLKAGEKKELRFIISKEELSFYNNALRWILEPGIFKVMIGAAADDIRLETEIELVK